MANEHDQGIGVQNETPQPLVIVTGSSGLIGTRLIENLADDYRVVGLDIKPLELAEKHPQVHWINVDLTNNESVQHVLHGLKDDHGDHIASVVHLAAYYDFSGEPSPLYEELTVKGTERLLRGLQQFNVEQFIFSSSLLVMASSESGEPVTASSPVDAEWDYPQSKVRAEEIIRRHRGEIPALISRLAGVYDDWCHSIPLGQQIDRIYQKQLESYLYPGDKTHGQSFIHLDDAVSSFRCAIERRHSLANHDALVLGEEDVMSYEQLQEELGKLIHGKEWPTIRIPKAMAKAGAWAKDKMASGDDDAPFIKPWMIDLADQNYPVNIRRARALLHWEPQHRLRDTLPAMVEHLKRDPRRWYEVNGLSAPKRLQDQEVHSE